MALDEVIALGESEVFVAAQQTHPRKLVLDKVCSAIYRSVVQKNDLIGHRDFLADGVETTFEVTFGVVAHQ